MKLITLAIIFGVGFIAGQYLIDSFNITGYMSAITGAIQGLINPNSTITAGGCSTNADCNSTSYCNLSNCSLSSGVCTIKPTVCPDVFNPVCSCNSVTYDNACLAAMNGSSVASQGSCS